MSGTGDLDLGNHAEQPVKGGPPYFTVPLIVETDTFLVGLQVGR